MADRHGKIGIPVLVTLLLFFGSVCVLPVSGQTANSTWTVMIYMSGDSSLSANVAADLDEIETVDAGDFLNIVVLSDRSSISDTKLYVKENGTLVERPLSEVNGSWASELNLGAAQTLVDFVTWGTANYPADHFILDLWGHGNGWEGLCPDKGDVLRMEELGEAMSGISGAGIDIDVVSIDACQMGMLEVVYELRDASRYAIVSEKDVPVDGWPYDEVLSIIADDPSLTVTEFGEQMINAYLDWGLVHSRYSLTASLIDLAGLDGLVAGLEQYTSVLRSTVGYFNREIIRARALTEEYDGNSEYDLVHLLENIDDQTSCRRLQTLSTSVTEELDAVVLYERHWTYLEDEPADNAHGLSIHFQSHVPSSRYLSTGFATDTAWDDFMTELAPYFSQPSRTEVTMTASAHSSDPDGDGLSDLLEISANVPSITGSLYELEVHTPLGALVYTHESQSSGWQNISYSPDALGLYSAAFYLWSAEGDLVNYTLIDEGLAKEGLSIIKGKVTSNIGRGQRWVQVTLYDNDGKVIGTTVTDQRGVYTLSLKVPTETEGFDLTLSCGLGSQQQNVTIESLFDSNTYDFQLGEAHWMVLWMVYIAVILNILSAVLIIGWSLRKPVHPE